MSQVTEEHTWRVGPTAKHGACLVVPGGWMVDGGWMDGCIMVGWLDGCKCSVSKS